MLAQIGYPSRDSVGNALGTTDWTGTWGYDYDSNNRLVGATPPNPVPGQPAGGDYEYDWVGNRTHPPGDPNPMVYNDGDQLVRWTGMYRYSYDGAGNLVHVRNDYYHFEELGSTKLITDGSGNITDRYTYDAYGSLLSHDCYPGSVNQPYQYVGQLGYYTRWMEPNFGLLHMSLRGEDVVELVNFLALDRGILKNIGVGNGSEFTSVLLDR